MSTKATVIGFLAAALVAWPMAAQADGGGPDRGGYEWADIAEDDVEYEWHEIDEEDRTEVELSDDDESRAIELGFAFTFYGTEYENIYIGSNGYVSFQTNNTEDGFIGQCPLPSEDTSTDFE